MGTHASYLIRRNRRDGTMLYLNRVTDRSAALVKGAVGWWVVSEGLLGPIPYHTSRRDALMEIERITQ